MTRVSGRIRRILVDGGLVSDEDWSGAKERGGSPVATLLSQGLLHEDALLETLGLASCVVPVDLSRLRPDPAALESLPRDTCRSRCFSGPPSAASATAARS